MSTEAPRARNVEFLLTHTGRILEAERVRTQNLDAKGAGLVAVGGVVLGLGAAFAGDFSSFRGVFGWIVLGSFTAALVALLAAVATSIVELAPRSFRTFSIIELEKYVTGSYLAREELQVQGTVPRGLVDSVAHARKVNNQKSRLVRCSYALFLVGLVLTLITGVLIAGKRLSQSDLQNSQPPCPGTALRCLVLESVATHLEEPDEK